MRITSRVRRIGERRDVAGLTVGYNTRGRRKVLGLNRRGSTAEVIDVSASGAQLSAPASRDIVVGQLITICAQGALGTVRVSRISPMPQRGLARVGVSFVHLDEALERYLLADVLDFNQTSSDVVWSR